MESFKEYLLQNKTVDFKFKGVDYHITIAGADVLEDYLVTMRETAKEYVSEIFRRLREHNYNPNLMKLHIVVAVVVWLKTLPTLKKTVYISMMTFVQRQKVMNI